MEYPEADVVVVGAGFAGLTAACELDTATDRFLSGGVRLRL